MRFVAGQGAAAESHREYVAGRGAVAESLCGRGCSPAEAVAAAAWKRLPLRGSRCVGDSPRKPLRHHREAATARDGTKHHREAAPSAKQGTFGTSILPNQQHREEHFLANNGAKWAGAEGVRGSNLACFLKNFVSNYIVIFLMMLFRVHL